MPRTQNATQTLLDAAGGDKAAADQLLPLVYSQLCAIAARHVRREAPGHSLQPTAVVHEAYIRLVDQDRADWQGKTHFCAVAASMIRRVLVDHARKRSALKRGGRMGRVTVNAAMEEPRNDAGVDLLALEDALHELERLNLRQARVVELRYFGGLTVREAAQDLGVSEETIKGDWRAAKAWLLIQLEL